MSPDDTPDSDETERTALQERAREDPESVDREAVESLLDGDADDRDAAVRVAATVAVAGDATWPVHVLARVAVDDPERTVASTATEALAEVAAKDPEAVDRAVPALRELVGGNPVVQHHVLFALMQVTERHPAAALPVLDEVVDRLDDDIVANREAAAWVLSDVATVAPDRVTPAVPRLGEIAATEREGVADVNPELIAGDDRGSESIREQEREADQSHQSAREAAVSALAALADEDATAVLPVVESLGECLRSDAVEIREAALRCLSRVGDVRPESLVPVVPALVDVVAGEAERVVATGPETTAAATWTLSNVAEVDQRVVTDALAPATGDLLALLDVDDPTVRGSAVGLLAYLAEDHPDALETHVDELVGALDDEEVGVRANAVVALSFIDDERATEAVRRAAEDDPSDDVRALATDVLERP